MGEIVIREEKKDKEQARSSGLPYGLDVFLVAMDPKLNTVLKSHLCSVK